MLSIIKQFLRHPIRSLTHPASILRPNTWSNDAYVSFLKANGAKIGRNTRFINPESCRVDFHRAEYIDIGENCCLSEVTILAHDYSWYTLLETYNDILPDPGGRVKIGNNCFIGFHSIILKDTTIGDNCIIAAGAVVKGRIPANTVWGGCPAKQICTIEDYYKKRVDNRVASAQYRRDVIRERFNREPTINEMGLFALLFLERSEKNYYQFIKDIEFNGNSDWPPLKNLFFESEPLFPSFEEFLNS